MKRSVKTGLLCMAVCLCFILTGCYIAPDDVNNGGGGDNTANNLPFNTLAPTPTVAVTPDTVVVETQNVFGITAAPGGSGGNQATPTPTPAGGTAGWNDWGTVQNTDSGNQGTATPVPSSGTFQVITPTPAPGGQETIAVVTAGPTKTPVALTPTPTPASLQQGFKGSDEVRALQKRLKELGYYSGSADGDFGPATEKAVRAFQKANGLTVDGKAGAKTLEKLNSKSAVSAKQANATATPKPGAKTTAKATATPRPTATPNLSKDYYLTIGSRGKKVTTLQRRLVELGWLSGPVTGEFDAATEAAVYAFQEKTKGLWTDGIAGPDTLRALYSSDAARTKTAVAGTGETLENGSKGDAVRNLQQKLKDLGYLSGSVDGSFGVATEAAVIAFQKNNNLTADGKAGTATQSKLYSGTAQKAQGNAVKISEGSSSSGGSSGNSSSGGNSGSSSGSNSGNSSGGSSNSGSGNSSSGSSSSSSGNTTTTVNNSGRDTSDIASTGYVTLENGTESEQVKTLQKRLKDLGYYNGNVDGRYGEGTQAAVMAFQLRNNLTVDGKAGPATQRVLYGSKSNITYASMYQGEEGTSVKNLQYTLYELGYYDGAIDGKYGATTADAVREFQIQNNLTPVDGIAGSKTLSKMYSSDAIAATASKVEYDTAKAGDQGDLVVQIQDCLIQLGFLDTITGEYDEATVAAVKAFQKANGLNPDGKCGTMTLQVLFGY